MKIIARSTSLASQTPRSDNRASAWIAAVAVGYDATRLFLGPLSVTPRGIDRVELEYARHFFRNSPGDCFAVIPTIWGIRCYPREQALRGLERIEELWPERLDLEQDRAWRSLKARIGGLPENHAAGNGKTGLAIRALRMASLLRATGIGLGSDICKTLPERAIYLNIGQVTLAIPPLLRWLRRRPDVRPVFMLHDVIPLETPEYVIPDAVRGHARMVDQTARYAAGLVVSTQAARKAVSAALAQRGGPELPTLALPFPVPTAFREASVDQPPLTDKPYFLVCGAIEPRKNHALLVEVWKRLHARLGAATPLLIVAGSPGWQSRFIEDRIERTPAAQAHIRIATGLSTAALRHLMAGATGLLMPSFIEGFGLPIVEAASLGTQVVASDIDAHREIAPASARLVDPIDGQGWERAILSLLERHHPPCESDISPLASDPFTSTWPDYFSRLTAFMAELKARSEVA
ncbi:glycosyltransferase family 1 protein [Bosea sp. BIWAKO-01]|uniref:glycosyltransferase family 4 protein n=1 Tax=Bosea sp. BIWAKO-01 TaxID=506668 RepID=UPI000852F5F6|nr:glycosyltransferase family 1 protein [Bosea sp. BIWAKO-01]GAU82906.1 glycosyl transferase group 1 [Bosea sp. BIWAKO-01]